MDVIGLIYCLELQDDIQDLKKLGLTSEEIEGFIEFDWEPALNAGLISSLLERGANDKH